MRLRTLGIVPTVEFVFIRVELFDTAIINDENTLLILSREADNNNQKMDEI